MINRISICPLVYDASAPLELTGISDFKYLNATRRVTRTPTLDGGSAFFDNGLAESDRTIRFSFVPKYELIVDLLQSYHRLYSELSIMIDQPYIGVIKSVTGGAPLVHVELYIKRLA